MIGFASVTGSSLIGVAIACSGNVLISLALTVQKLAHRRQNEELMASRSGSGSTSGTHSPDAPERGDEDGQERYKDEPAKPASSTSISSDGTIIPVLLVPASTADTSSAVNGTVEERNSEPNTNTMGRRTSLDSVPENEAMDGITERLLDAEARGSTGQNGRSKSPGPARIRIPPVYDSGIRLQLDSAGTDKGDGNGTKGRDGDSSRDDGGQPDGGDEDDDGEGGEKAEVEEGMYLKSKLWWFGLALISIGEGGNFLSYGFAPASVVAPLGTVALIANCIFAPLILKETFHAKELIGMAMAILGAVTVVWSSRGSNPRLDPESLLVALKQLPFLIYTLINALLIAGLTLLSRSPRWEARFIGIDVGICALYGGYTVLSTKALSSLLSTIFFDAFEYWVTWGLLFVLVVTSILQVKYLNRALMKFQSKEVIPTQFVFFSLAAIIGSAVLYQEFRDVSFSVAVNFAFGIATTFLGVYLLTSFSQSEDDDNADTSDDENTTSNGDQRQPRRPGPPSAPQRATSSASLNLLLPTTSRLSERTPLLIPVTESPNSATNHLPGAALATSLKGRLMKRASTSEFTPTLGLSSAGFLLMASTPPSSGGGLGAGHGPGMRRERSSSRAGAGSVYTDVERGQNGERSGSGGAASAGVGVGGRGHVMERQGSERSVRSERRGTAS